MVHKLIRSLYTTRKYLDGIEFIVGQVQIIIIINVSSDGSVIVSIAAEKGEDDSQTDHLHEEVSDNGYSPSGFRTDDDTHFQWLCD